MKHIVSESVVTVKGYNCRVLGGAVESITMLVRPKSWDMGPQLMVIYPLSSLDLHFQW